MAAPTKHSSDAEIRAFVDHALSEMTLAEKIYMMSGHGFYQLYKESGRAWGADPYQAGGGCERLGIPPFYFTDGPRGVIRGSSTCFPVPMARGAAFDTDLERRIGEAMGIEARAQGCNLSGAVCINLLRHPAWGRAQETYGEDPYHLGEMGAALAEGIQTHNVAATVKHFALNSVENARFKIDVHVDRRTLHEVYLPHFKRVLDAGCATVMSAYNKVNGAYCGQNRNLLTDILREEWGFDGFVHSDWFKGVYEPYGAIAGLDVENPEPNAFGERLQQAVEDGTIEPEVIDTACRRILITFYRFHCAEDPLDDYPISLVACAAHRALAREAAQKSAVLLKNDGLLPLAKDGTKKLAVLGRLADLVNTGDRGSSHVSQPDIVTPLAGLREFLGDDAEILTGGEEDIEAAAAAARTADAAVVVVGYTYREEGEFVPGDLTMEGADSDKPRRRSFGGDRDSLSLPPQQEALIAAVCAANPRTVVVVVAGSAVMMNRWREEAGAILQTFYAGMEGGRALADLLFGAVSPSGKLPFTVPESEADLPYFDKDADQIEYGLLHGYTLLEHEGKAPAFPFGFGLSYTNFAYRALNVRRTGDHISVSVAVRNTGGTTADEIVQLYVGFPGRAAPRPKKLLRGFQRLSLGPGETRVARFSIPLSHLAWWKPASRGWVLESGEHIIYAGGSSREAELLHTRLPL